MAIVLIQTWAGMGDGSTHDAVVEKMGVEKDPPVGLIAHTFGQTPGGDARIVDVWESRDAFESFERDRLRPALQAIFQSRGEEPVRPETEMYDASYVLHPH